ERIPPSSLSRMLELQRAPAGSAPDVARLEPLLRDLRETPKPQTWWERFKQWVQGLIDAGSRSTQLPWLQQWLDRLTPGKLVLKIVGYALMALIVIAASVIVARELRASNWRSPAWRRRASGVAAAVDADETTLDLEALRRLPVAERPRLLFQIVAAR